MWFQKPPLGIPLDWGNPLNDGTVLALAMNEGHGDKVQDLSLNGNHGTLHNFAFPPTVTSGWNPGQTGVGANFDGIDDKIGCGSNAILNNRNDFTISSMLFPSFDIGAVGGASADRIGWYQNTRNVWCMFRDGKQHYTFRDAAGAYHNCDGNKTSWNTDEWYILTLTYSVGNGYNLYVNGTSDGSGADFGALMVGSVDVLVGYYNKYYTGALDQPRIQSSAWSAKEVRDYAINPWQVYLDE